MKLIVIGLDGASFELIDPWIKEGELPNMAKIKQQGVWADMRSVLPPVTSPNWKSYSTGKNPGKIGIFWWENIDWQNRRVYFPVHRTIENMEIWDYIGEAGMKVGVMGMPTIYRPKKVNGFLIAGAEAGDKNFTYPEALEGELKRLGWRNNPQIDIEIDRTKATQEIHEIIDQHFRIASILGKRYDVDFLQIVVFPINTLHHFLWDAEETKVGWQIIDRYVGDILDKGCDVIIMSDHGSNRIETVFHINTWLEREGYLHSRHELIRTLCKLGISQENMMTLLARLKMLSLARRLIPSSLRRALPDASGEVGREAKATKIDWQRSKALASGQGPIYLNPFQDNGALKQEIKQKLEALVDPKTGSKIIERAYFREEIYYGRYLAEAPDLIMDQAREIHIPGGIGQRRVFTRPQRWRAENKKAGLFMAYGPSIKEGEGKIENISILDLAPTILHIMDISVPEDMDGGVLREIFKEGSEPARREVIFRKSRIDEKEKIRRKLRVLRNQGKV